MVKVLKCYNFKSSNIIENVISEPNCFDIGKNFLFIGTHDCTVKVFKNTQPPKKWQKYCFFQTGALVTQVEYNKAGDYVATVEKKVSRQSEVVSVKVYLNWHIAHQSDSYRTRVRVAGLGYKSSNVQTGKRLEVVDVPIEGKVSAMSTCAETGNLVFACNHIAKLFHLVEKTIPNSEETFLDMIVFLEISFGYDLTKICLCEEFLVCSSSQFVQVFEVQIRDRVDDMQGRSVDSQGPSPRRMKASSVLSSLNIAQNISSPETVRERTVPVIREQPKFSAVGERGSSTPSPGPSFPSKNTTSLIEDDTDFVQWSFSSNPLARKSTGLAGAQLHGYHDNKTIKLKGLENLGKPARFEPPVPDIKDLRGGNHHTTGQTSLKQVMYHYLDQGHSSWLHLQLIPTYTIGGFTSLSGHQASIPVHSGRRTSRVGMTCLMSSPRVGQIFSLLPHPLLLSSYEYSSNALQVESSGPLLYVLHENTLEIYTSRSHIFAVLNTEKMDHVTKTCPDTSVEICICGVQHLIGPRLIALGDKHIALFNKIDNSWNVNVLEKPSVPDLYTDMVNFGKKNQQLAAHTYEHMLLEGHMLLTSSLIGQSLSQSDAMEVQELIRTSSALLGEYYALSDAPGWQSCLPYCIMSELNVQEMVSNIRQRKKEYKLRYGQGIVQYLKYVLFLEEDPLDLIEVKGDTLLETCFEAMPDRLSDVLLFSRIRTYSAETAINFLKKTSKYIRPSDSRSSTKYRLALASLNLQLCEPDMALGLLSAIDKRELVDLCVENHHILHVAMTEFSPLAQLMRCHDADLLISILIQLHDMGTMPTDLAIALLQGRSNVPEAHKNSHLMAYLEALVCDEKRKFCFEDAVGQLCEMYVLRLAEWEPPSIRQLSPVISLRLPKGGHFGRRHGWLDQLPPFSGTQSITTTCQYVVPSSESRRAGKQSQQWLQCQKTDNVTCSCFMCNEDLLKIQSLLCYPEVSSTVCDRVLPLLEANKHHTFSPSLNILCQVHTDIDAAVRLVIESHMTVAAEFGASVLKSDVDKWEKLLNKMLEKVFKAEEANQSTEEFMPCVKDVLAEMSKHLKPEEFLKVLPGNGNFFFFMPYIQQCLAIHKGAKLKEHFVELGGKMVQHSCE
ncbi:BLOC-2 complex member HPS3-like isoform X2 [Mya arenaria]|uniref:BLOC-2 complex member HPS3-like isoform X2 n=1 Tax=Mya arenaria TaxID=6604 RepID=UPI0022E10C7E|nr:BLOC-2 complex member HPS3-like isoform X2 [Mya arenaria]